MKMWKRYTLGLAAMAGLTPGLWAQLPAAPAVPAAGVPAVPVAPAAAPAPTTIFTFLGLGPQSLAACKAKLCACPVGQLLSNAMLPMSALTGGIIHPLCPPDQPNPADLAKPADSAEGAAARIKASEAGAKARAAACRYLGTVDCHYYPEAGDALCNALRKDRNECVRWEAAMALGRGCCCNKTTIMCLSIAVSGSERDGAPAETAERVIAAATFALENCLAKLAPPMPLGAPEAGPKKEGTLPPPKEGVPPPKPSAMLPPFYHQLDKMSMQQVTAFAKQALEKNHVAANNPIVHPTDGHSLYAVFSNSFGNRSVGTPVVGSTNNPASTPIVVAAPIESTSEPRLAPVAVATPAPRTKSVPMTVATPPMTVAAIKPAAPLPAPAPTPTFTQVSHRTDVTSAQAVQMPAPGSTAATVGQLVAVLQGATYPEQRQWAADNLAGVRWQANPTAVAVLVATSHGDTAASVRAACVRSLGKLGANTPEVVEALRAARKDSDLRVRLEADRALGKLKSPYQPTDQVSSIRWFGNK
jgi:HEAT repeats